MKKFSKVLSLLLVFAMIVPGIAQAATVDAEEAAVVTRISGGNRYQTAANVSNQKFGKSKTVVLASGENWPDALAGTALAGVEGAPILLTAARRLHPDTKAELISLGAEKVIIVGGETVIPAAVADELKAMGLTVDRKEGLKREDTAVAAAKGMTSKTAIIANGYENFADALSAGAYAGMNGMPILFVRQNSVPAGTLEGLKALGIENVIIAGGTSAVSAKVQSELAAYNPTRIYGEVREETSLAFAEKFADNKEVIIANGYDYADALAGAALGAKIGAPVVLVNTNSMKTVVKEFIGENADKNHTVIGGTSAVSNNVVSDIEEIIAPVEEDELKVVSVSAINGVTVEVKFSQPVDKDAAEAVVEAGVNDTSAVVAIDGLNLQDPTLSKDGKTLTLTSMNAITAGSLVPIDVTNAKVTVAEVPSKDDATIKTKEYAALLTYKDTVAPTATTERVSTNSFKIKFSEPVQGGTITAKYADGTAISPALTLALTSGADELAVDLSDPGVKVGKDIEITLNGVADIKGNLITPQPTKLTVVKLANDGILPAITSVTQTGAKTFTIKFNKDLDGNLIAGDIQVTNNTVNSLTRKEASLYEVGVTTNLNGLQTVTVLADKAVDLSGQKNATALTHKVTFTTDLTAPKATAKLVTVDGAEYIELTFDKDVIVDASTTVNVSGNQVKDFITTTVSAADIGSLAYKDADNEKVVLVPLTASALAEKGAVYNLTLKASSSNAITSDAGTAMADVKVTFTRGENVTPNAKKITDVVLAQGSTPSEVTATFTLEDGTVTLDGATATNIANYTIAGATIESATLAAKATEAATEQVVTLTIKDGSNTFTGSRNYSVKNVKIAGSSAVMTPVSKTMTLSENVAPTYTAELTANNQIKLIFSENVIATTGSGAVDEADFVVKVDGVVVTQTAATSSITDTAAGTTITLNLTDAIKDVASKTITVEASAAADVVDALADNTVVGNKLITNVVTVTK